jgi:hypothetical protein
MSALGDARSGWKTALDQFTIQFDERMPRD